MKIVFPAFRYNYGKKERGESIEKIAFLPALRDNVDLLLPFWLEDNGYPKDKKNLQNELLNFVHKEKPDIVFFILMRDEIALKTIEEISKRHITINWFCDDQWRFETFTKFIAPKLTYSITVDKYSIPKYKDIGYNNVILSQWAATEYIKNINFNDIRYKYDISFVGGKNPTREYYINSLIKSGYRVECFGYGWDNGGISYEQMKDVFLHSKINLNLSNSYSFDMRIRKYVRNSLYKSLLYLKPLHSLEELKNFRRHLIYKNNIKNIEQIKMRNFEIPASGGFQLSQFALSIEDYFTIGKEIAVFNNIDELKKQLDFYLKNDIERERIRNNGYLRAKNHIYRPRLGEIFKKINL